MKATITGLSRLTFTRFIAALIVVAFHFGANVTPFSNEEIAAIFRQGPYAVQYFFTLSGFIMASVYATNKPTEFDIKQFWIARFARVYPVYLIGLALSLSISKPDILTIILNLTLTQAWSATHALSMNNPGWSLSVEVFFYALFPLIIFLLNEKNLKLTTVTAVFLCLLHESLNQYAYYIAKNEIKGSSLLEFFGPYFPISNLPFFLAGSVFGALLKFGKLKKSIRLSSLSPLTTTIILCLWIYFRLPLIMIPFGLFILSLATNKQCDFLSSKPLIFLGEASYSIYIIHFPLYILFLNYVSPQINTSESVKFYIYMITLISISCLTYEFVEKPCRTYIRSTKIKSTAIPS